MLGEVEGVVQGLPEPWVSAVLFVGSDGYGGFIQDPVIQDLAFSWTSGFTALGKPRCRLLPGSTIPETKEQDPKATNTRDTIRAGEVAVEIRFG